MSNIISYLRTLAPVYERRDLLAALNQIQEEHSTTVTPVVQNLREAFANYQFKSALAKGFASALGKYVNYGRTSPVELVLDSLDQLQLNYPFLEREVRRLFSIQFTTAQISYDRVNLLRYIEQVAFYVRYARKLLLCIVGDEAALIGGTKSDWSRAEKEWLLENMQNFCGSLDAINKPEAQLKQVLSGVSTAEVDEETAELAARTLGAKGTDPMRLQQFSPQRNPLLAMGKWMAEGQVKRYKAAKDELKALQLRLQELRELQASGKAKPSLQKFIQQTEERIQDMDRRCEQFEQDNAYV